MKSILIASALTFLALVTKSSAAGSIRVPGQYVDKKLVTIVSHDDLKASSAWRLGEGEPPITSIQAADLAINSQKSQFPELKNVTIKEISLCSTENGCYYRVMLYEEPDKEVVIKAGGTMTPNQMSYFVLLNSKVLNPMILPPKEED